MELSAVAGIGVTDVLRAVAGVIDASRAEEAVEAPREQRELRVEL